MTDDPLKQLPRELFDAWAAHLGIDTDPDHLDRLYPETAALLRRVAQAHLVDTSDVDPAEASETLPRGMTETGAP